MYLEIGKLVKNILFSLIIGKSLVRKRERKNKTRLRESKMKINPNNFRSKKMQQKKLI